MATARPPGTTIAGPDPRWARLISLVIAGALTLQVLALLLRTGPWAFPFINYPMYAVARYEGDRILAEHTITAVFADGTERVLTRADVGDSYWFYENWARRMVAFPGDTYVLGSDPPYEPKRATGIRRWLKQQVSRDQVANKYIDAFTKRVEAGVGKTIVRYRIEDYPAILTRGGYKDADGRELLKVLNIGRG